MKANYLCPKCRTYLNVGDKIVISAKNARGYKGILLFSIHLGDYEIKKHSNFDIEENESLSMFCPCCHKSLRHPKVHNNIFKILMQDAEDQEYEKVSAFGKDAGKYLNFTNLINMS